MEIPEFDIFLGSLKEGPRWLESVRDLATVRVRLEKLAAANPGRYFAYSLVTREVVAEVDTSAQMFRLERSIPKAKDAA
jgi:hypothetical protein